MSKHLWHVMTGQVHKIETNPITQYRFHLFFTWAWFMSILTVPLIVPHKNGAEFVALVILEVSLWANFVSHMTAVGAAVSAIYAAGMESAFTENHHMFSWLVNFIRWRRASKVQFTNPNYQPSGWDSLDNEPDIADTNRA